MRSDGGRCNGLYVKIISSLMSRPDIYIAGINTTRKDKRPGVTRVGREISLRLANGVGHIMLKRTNSNDLAKFFAKNG